ncbi:histidine kinase [Pseudoflavitalea sp. X16]|uniref:sensor histidine kinase n=1 Tax=Paraflavitalea devenefica TaxID=2716334 RepID=UPI0014211D17|nr:histidine kinase [Paraflavitalea devenefica]NII29515.1 histidine kinase [Paraflavitalea devenefica]
MSIRPGCLFFLFAYIILHPVPLDAQDPFFANAEQRMYTRTMGIQVSNEDLLDYNYGMDGYWSAGNWNPVLAAVGGNNVYLYFFLNHSANWQSTGHHLQREVDPITGALDFKRMYGENRQQYHYNSDFRILIDTVPVVGWTNLRQLIETNIPHNLATGNLLVEPTRFARYHFLLLPGKKLRIEVRNATTKKMEAESYIIARLPSLPAIAAVGDLADGKTQMALLHDRDSLQLNANNLPFEKDHTITLGAGVRNIVVLPKRYPGLDKIFIEYKLESGTSAGSKWAASSDRVIPLFNLNNLEAGKTYDLYLRYNNTPDIFSHYKIIVQQHWWQTGWFKITTVLLAILLFLSIAFLWYRRRQQRQLQSALLRQQLLAAEMRSIRSQLNPHFVFNAMSSIQSLINKRDIYRANQYLSLFSQLMREVLTNSEKAMITLEEELQTLHNYLELEKLRFGFSYFLHTGEIGNTGNIEFPAMLLQPLVENSIKHGISAMNAGGIIDLRIRASSKDMIIELHDNGKGFDAKEEQNGFGLKSVHDRIQLINQSVNDRRIAMVIAPEAGNGTSILLTFFNWLP